MSEALPIPQLQSIYFLFKEKEEQLNQEINNLQLRHVKDDTAFEATVTRIKKSILLVPVEFLDPVIKEHRTEQKMMPPNYQSMWGGKKDIIIVPVNFPFTGSYELFRFAPNGFTFGGSSTRVYQPDYGNSISVEVQVEQHDKATVLARANSMMDTTLSLISQINPSAKQWSEQNDPKIDAALQAKRKELIDFYK